MTVRIIALLSCMLFSMQSIHATNGQPSKHVQKQIRKKIANLEDKKRNMARRFSPVEERELKRLKQLIAKPVSAQPRFPQESLPQYDTY